MYDLKGYCEAETVTEAIGLLAANLDLRIIAGGTDVLIKLQHGQSSGAELLSIRRIKELTNIELLENGTIVIGALATFAQIFANVIIKEHIPALAEAAVSMGGPQIRNIATIGGNVCNGATSADSASTLFALDAKLKLVSSGGERIVPVREFYLGPGKVDLKPGELLCELLIPPESYAGFGGHYVKFAMRKAMDIATLGVSVMCKLDRNCFARVKIGLGVAGPTPLRCMEAENYAIGKPVSETTLAEIGKLAVTASNARTSWRASKEYREHLVEVLTQRALKVAILRAGGEDLA
ncbi:MAG TPA: xanthine dehydrogenase FAD-binding subunit XdhB [Verrucomicrobiae bacterium]|nr:xanthine dehydrogenase FAD-binding subunit XdhB [Verrucomicrobiae bacterium]